MDGIEALRQRHQATIETAGIQPATTSANDPGETKGSVWYIVMDSADPQAAAAFWSAVLGVSQHGPYVSVGPLAPGGPSIAFQRVPEPKHGKNRVHLDVATDNAPALAERVIALGGEQVREFEEHGNRWVVMGDPDGNEFCVTELGHLARPPAS